MGVLERKRYAGLRPPPVVAGDYRPVHVDAEDGDVDVNGVREFDCPIYDDED